MAERQHRVKNNLQLILGFITLQISRTSDRSSRTILEQAARRIHGVGLIQHRLASVDVTGSVDLAEYLPPLVRDIVGAEALDTIEFEAHVESVIVLNSRASVIGYIVNELLTNSMKHAFPDGKGRLMLHIKKDGEYVEITVADDGPGFAGQQHDAARKSVGNMILNALTKKLHGTITRADNKGAEVIVRMRLLDA